MDAHYFTAYSYKKLLDGLPNAKLIDSERLVNWVRVVKSDVEIDLMKKASKITELGMKKAFDTIKPGIRQSDLVSEITGTLIKGTKDYGGDYSAIVPLLPTGKGTSASHLTWSDSKFVEGEATIIELSGVYRNITVLWLELSFLGNLSKNNK